MTAPASWRPVVAPLAFFAGAGALTRFITDRPEEAAAMARGIAGPTTWPRFMLYGTMLFAAGWGVQRVAQVLREFERERDRPGSAHRQSAAPAATAHVWLGIILVLAYGFGLPLLGFALATLLYFALWLPLGGVRSPLQVAAVALVGTTALLYLFVKVALMPLDRGYGTVGEITVELYRWLRIY